MWSGGPRGFGTIVYTHDDSSRRPGGAGGLSLFHSDKTCGQGGPGSSGRDSGGILVECNFSIHRAIFQIGL